MLPLLIILIVLSALGLFLAGIYCSAVADGIWPARPGAAWTFSTNVPVRTGGTAGSPCPRKEAVTVLSAAGKRTHF